eukprot:7555488-Prorocentrum_lima.AAC.1
MDDLLRTLDMAIAARVEAVQDAIPHSSDWWVVFTVYPPIGRGGISSPQSFPHFFKESIIFAAFSRASMIPLTS